MELLIPSAFSIFPREGNLASRMQVTGRRIHGGSHDPGCGEGMEVFMNSTYSQPELIVVEPAGFTELVRGTEQRLITLFAPLVQRQSVALDLNKIERIDAAGIAALITLYSDAIQSGHTFSVCNLSAHVGEILSLVGLAPILIAKEAAPAHNSAQMHSSAQQACAAA